MDSKKKKTLTRKDVRRVKGAVAVSSHLKAGDISKVLTVQT
jgi:hypothetical protein